MRQGEILELTWDKVDFERYFIRLAGRDTKNGFKRRIPIHPRVREMLSNLPRGLHTGRVSLSRGRHINNFAGNYKLQWSRAVQESELGDFLPSTTCDTVPSTTCASPATTTSPSWPSPATEPLQFSGATM